MTRGVFRLGRKAKKSTREPAGSGEAIAAGTLAFLVTIFHCV
jgi:hypothetical protein